MPLQNNTRNGLVENVDVPTASPKVIENIASELADLKMRATVGDARFLAHLIAMAELEARHLVENLSQNVKH